MSTLNSWIAIAKTRSKGETQRVGAVFDPSWSSDYPANPRAANQLGCFRMKASVLRRWPFVLLNRERRTSRGATIGVVHDIGTVTVGGCSSKVAS
jgi:hypothetical protein